MNDIIKIALGVMGGLFFKEAVDIAAVHIRGRVEERRAEAEAAAPAKAKAKAKAKKAKAKAKAKR
jgi:hypothetical protein